jgi:hypothetical protein
VFSFRSTSSCSVVLRLGGVMGLRDVALRVRGSKSLMLATATALSLVFFLLVDRLAPAVAQMMALPGKSAVDPNGGAGYSIAIAVPPGTAGLAPTRPPAHRPQ